MAREPVGLEVTVRAPEMRIVDEKGHWLSAAQKQLYKQNREIAIDMQGEIGRRIGNSLQRPLVSSHRLVTATGDADNIHSDRYFVGVGDVKYLNRSIAKYWRTAEQGTAESWEKREFTTLPLQGLWGTNVAGWARLHNPWIHLGGKTKRAAPVDRGGGEQGGQEMYHPFRLGKGANLPVYYPKHDTKPMHAYQAVALSPDFSRRNLAVAANFWAMVLNRGIRPSGFFGDE